MSGLERSAGPGFGRWPVVTRSGRARLRDRRLSDLRAFAAVQEWQVLGLHQDLSVRHPVPPLLGAVSAQAELAVAGTWEQWPALVASVLVQPPQRPRAARRRDLVVQLTMLDTGPLPSQFSAEVTDHGVEVAGLSRTGELLADAVRSWLEGARRRDAVRRGDHLAADEVELVHTREVGYYRARVDVEGPLRVLSALARSLG